MLKDFLESVFGTAKERVTNPLFGGFVIAWCITNWKVIYITVFTGEDMLFRSQSVLKIDYILALYPLTFWTLSKLVLIPFASVFIVFWVLFEVDKIIYKKSISNKIEKRLIKKRNEQILLQEESKTLEKRIEVIEKKEKKKEIEQSSELKEESIWTGEFNFLSSNSDFQIAMRNLRESIYEYNGAKSDRRLNGWRLDPQSLSLLHVNEVIDDPMSEKISLTPKGRFFMKLHISRK